MGERVGCPYERLEAAPYFVGHRLDYGGGICSFEEDRRMRAMPCWREEHRWAVSEHAHAMQVVQAMLCMMRVASLPAGHRETHFDPCRAAREIWGKPKRIMRAQLARVFRHAR
jgi:hypothetical protein